MVQPVDSLPPGVVAAHLPASKDVEAVTPAALSAAAEGRRRGTPVAEACLATLLYLGIDASRSRILIIGHGSTGGRPIAQRLLATGAQVSVVQSDIANVHPLPPYDVLISAIGIAGVMPKAAIRPGTTVLDVGTSMVDGQLRGDVSPAVSYTHLLPKGARLGAAPAGGSGQDRGGGRRRHVQVGVAAEALVVDGLGDRGMLATDRALGVAPKAELGELHRQRVDVQQPACLLYTSRCV